jgi:hypothetical protein
VQVGPVAERCEALIREKAVERHWRIVACEVMPDHVHMFVRTHPVEGAVSGDGAAVPRHPVPAALAQREGRWAVRRSGAFLLLPSV